MHGKITYLGNRHPWTDRYKIFCMPSAVQDVITPANFCEDWLRGFGVARVEFWPFPFTCFVAFKTLSHYRASV